MTDKNDPFYGNWPRHPGVPGEVLLYGAPGIGDGIDAPWVVPPNTIPAIPVPPSSPLIDLQFAQLMNELRTLRQAVERGHEDSKVLAEIVKVLRPDMSDEERVGFPVNRLPTMISDLEEQLANESARADEAERARDALEKERDRCAPDDNGDELTSEILKQARRFSYEWRFGSVAHVAKASEALATAVDDLKIAEDQRRTRE